MIPIGKATQDRDFRHADTKKLHQEITASEIKLSELDAEIKLLTSSITTLDATLAEATTLWDLDKKRSTSRSSTRRRRVLQLFRRLVPS